MSRRAAAEHAYSTFVSLGKTRLYRRYRIELIPGKREGVFIHDLGGRRYFNFHCSGGVFNFGHRNAEFTGAACAALENLDVGSWCAHGVIRERLAQALASHMPEGLSQVLLCASGSEAADAAIKVATAATGRSRVLSAIGGYHGGSGFAVAVGDERFRTPFGPPMENFEQLRFGDAAAFEKAIDRSVAAVILETIPASLGMTVPPDDFYPRVRQACDKHGALLIMDEVQTGFGRTGRLWGFDHWNVKPDAVLLGKGFSGGIYPIAAVCFDAKLAPVFDAEPILHYSEYGGSDIGCAVALSVLERATSPDHLAHVNELASFFGRELGRLLHAHPDAIIEIRQKGLFMAIRFADEPTCALMMKILFDNGIYVIYAANDKRVLQFLPALTISEQEAAEAIAILERSLADRRRLKYRALAAILRLASPKAV